MTRRSDMARTITQEELERRVAFYEKRMNDPKLKAYWRDKSEAMYWHYLDLATRTENNDS
jgi:hypothetical protein